MNQKLRKVISPKVRGNVLSKPRSSEFQIQMTVFQRNHRKESWSHVFAAGKEARHPTSHRAPGSLSIHGEHSGQGWRCPGPWPHRAKTSRTGGSLHVPWGHPGHCQLRACLHPPPTPPPIQSVTLALLFSTPSGHQWGRNPYRPSDAQPPSIILTSVRSLPKKSPKKISHLFSFPLPPPPIDSPPPARHHPSFSGFESPW